MQPRYSNGKSLSGMAGLSVGFSKLASACLGGPGVAFLFLFAGDEAAEPAFGSIGLCTVTEVTLSGEQNDFPLESTGESLD